jgi:hypothetical protein
LPFFFNGIIYFTKQTSAYFALPISMKNSMRMLKYVLLRNLFYIKEALPATLSKKYSILTIILRLVYNPPRVICMLYGFIIPGSPAFSTFILSKHSKNSLPAFDER